MMNRSTEIALDELTAMSWPVVWLALCYVRRRFNRFGISLYDATRAYALSKLCNVLHTRELAHRLKVGSAERCKLKLKFEKINNCTIFAEWILVLLSLLSDWKESDFWFFLASGLLIIYLLLFSLMNLDLSAVSVRFYYVISLSFSNFFGILQEMGANVIANCVNPGVVRTRLTREREGFITG